MGDSSPAEIALPAMPPMAGTELWTGDDRDGACFIYEELDGALTVTGLTAEGAERSALTVPSAWNGLPVTVIGANAIQKNIRAMADGAFSGCAALERIVLEQDAPSACRVGQGLLKGTKAGIYVPAKALSAYRTDYFWSVYGALILPRE